LSGVRNYRPSKGIRALFALVPPAHGERERGTFLSRCRCLSAVDALGYESTMDCCSRPAASHMFIFEQQRLRHALVTGRAIWPLRNAIASHRLAQIIGSKARWPRISSVWRRLPRNETLDAMVSGVPGGKHAKKSALAVANSVPWAADYRSAGFSRTCPALGGSSGRRGER
jgi:hypothetical protein